jgi:hypothetical protein
MAIDTLDKATAALDAAQRPYFYKTSVALEAVGVLSSLWTAAGTPVAGAAQGSLNGANCDKSTTGAIPLTNAGSGSLYLLGAEVNAPTVPGTVTLYDRIWHNSTMSGTATGTNTITQPALPARVTDSGLGCSLGVEVFTSWGTTAVTLTVTYRDSDDAVDRTSTLTTVVPGGSGAPAAGTFVDLVPANTRGVKRVVSYGWSSTTGTAGNFGLVLFRPIARVFVPAPGIVGSVDFFGAKMPKILNDACLAMLWTGNATTAQGIYGNWFIGAG